MNVVEELLCFDGVVCGGVCCILEEVEIGG